VDSKKSSQSDDQGFNRDQAQQIAVATDDFHTKELRACVRFYAEILHLLHYAQPLSAKELTAGLRTSKDDVFKKLKRLKKYGLVKQIEFESHVLYCIDGKFNPLIHSVLNE